MPTAPFDPSKRGTAALLLAACVLFALPLLAHAYAGTAARFVGDDYCAGYIFRDEGHWRGQWWYYRNWGAVPSTMLLMAITDPGGSWLTRWLPGAALLTWVGLAAWAIRELSALGSRTWSWLASTVLAELLVYATLQDAPNVVQSLYLRVPMLAYTAPLITLTGYIGFLASVARRRTASVPALLASATLAFFGGSFGPVYDAFQTTGLAVAWLVTRVAWRPSRERAAERLLIAGLVGSVASLAFVALAPGNAVRQQVFPHMLGLFSIATSSVLYAIFMCSRPFLPLLQGTIVHLVPVVLPSATRWLSAALEMATSPATGVMVIAAGACFSNFSARADHADRRWVRPVLIGVAPIAFLLVVASMAPGAYGTSAPPPPRALIIPQFGLTSLEAVWGYALGSLLRQRNSSGARRAMTALAVALGVSLVAAGPVVSTVRTLRASADLRRWAQHWDETDRQLRAAKTSGQLHARVSAVEKIGGVGSISPDPGDWVNICAAHYYGLASITGLSTPR